MFKKSIAKGLGAIAAGALMLGVAAGAQASLIGDPEVTFEIQFTADLPGVNDAPFSDTETFGPIGPGTDHIFSIADGGAFFVEIDIGSEDLYVKITNVTNFVTPSDIRGFIRFTGLDWVGQDGSIEDFEIASSTFTSIPGGALVDNGHGVEFEIFQNSLATESSVEARFNLQVVHVPEPGTLTILGLGLAGLGLARRKRMI